MSTTTMLRIEVLAAIAFLHQPGMLWIGKAIDVVFDVVVTDATVSRTDG
jgi:hypothetical protein